MSGMDILIEMLKRKEIILYVRSVKDEFVALELDVDVEGNKIRKSKQDGTPVILMKVKEGLPQDIREMIDR